MKIAVIIILNIIFGSIYYFIKNQIQNGEVKKITQKYEKQLNEKPINQAFNKLTLQNIKKDQSSVKNDSIKKMNVKIQNEILYKDEIPYSKYFSNTSESQNLFNAVYAKFQLKDKKDYYQFKAEFFKQLNENPVPYRTAITEIITQIPINQHLNEKRELYEIASTLLIEPDEQIKNIILNDISSLPSRPEPKEKSHIVGEEALTPKTEALYQAVNLYRKIIKDPRDIAQIKSQIINSQKNKMVQQALLNLL